MAIVGYIRVSSIGQNVERQLEGLTLDETFTDKVSGKSLDRPALQEMLRFVRRGDEVLVHSMDRLARNLGDLLHLVKTLTGKGVRVTFRKEALTFTGDDSPVATLMLSIIGAVAAFERSMIRDRQLEGIAIAKAKGVYKGGKPKLNADQVAQLCQMALAGEKKAVLARHFGISRETLYSYLRAEKSNKPKSQPGWVEERVHPIHQT
jgi:DNA invertase Pin-like site-specific DNA recombinase